MKFIFHRLKLNKKLRRAFVFFVVLSLGIGFAYIQSDLNINTFLTAIKGKWQLDYTNFKADANSTATDESYNYNNETNKITFTAPLNSLSDYYSFSFDIENNGTIEAKLNSLTLSGLSEEEQEYVDYTVTYIDNATPKAGDGIEVDTKETIIVTVKYKDTSSVTSGTYNLSLHLDYGKSDGYITRPKTLYRVLEQEATKGTLAKKYTGEHNDSMDASKSTENIYHWYADNDNDKANEILDKNNVIFANHCWLMIRTTDTGGVKMIYNGIPNDGKCNNTGAAQQIATSRFNNDYKSLSDVGYMYNKRYPSNYKYFIENALSSTRFSTSYYYADSYTYDSSTNKYTLDAPYLVNSSDIDTLVGKYTFSKNDSSFSSDKIYYIINVSGNTFYTIELENNNSYSSYNYIISYGDSYTDNGDGTYTINNYSTLNRFDFYLHFRDIDDKYICINANNGTCSDLWYSHYSNTSYYFAYTSIDKKYSFSNSFTYDENTDTYNLTGDTTTFWDLTEENIAKLKTHHYTCFNDIGECDKIYYVFFAGSLDSFEFITLDDGVTVETAINDMLYADNLNTTNSAIKTVIDDWYLNNINTFGDYIEDTVFCYDRSLSSNGLNGFNINGGNTSDYIRFIGRGNDNKISCEKSVDRYSLSNNKAKLDYPIGLLTYGEYSMLNSYYLFKTGNSYWIYSPDYYNGAVYMYEIGSRGYTSDKITSGTSGVRPVISVIPDIKASYGDGSKEYPYYIDTSY